MGVISGAIKAVIVVVVILVVLGIAAFAVFVHRARKLKNGQGDDPGNDMPLPFKFLAPPNPGVAPPGQVMAAAHDPHGQYFHDVKPAQVV